MRFEVDAKVGEDRGGEVLRGNLAVQDRVALAIGGADDLTVTEAAAGENQRHHVGPVVAAGVAVDDGGAAEFAHHQDQRLVEQSALFEVLNQGGEGGGRRAGSRGFRPFSIPFQTTLSP